MWKWRTIVAALALLSAAGAVLFLIAFREARSDPVVRELAVRPSDWPPGEPSVRVALLSDIHIGSASMNEARLARIVTQVNARRPDLVLLAGDFVFGHDPAEARRAAPGLRALAALRPRLGTIAVPGNHDHWTDWPAIRRVLEAAGVTVAANAAVRRGPLAILAVDDAFTGRDDGPAAMRSAGAIGGWPVLLSHSPDAMRRLPPGIPLILAGHTHCGQIVLPGLGAPADRGALNGTRLYDPPYRCGMIREQGRLLIVTAGLGTSGLPLRLGARPDWWLLTIGPAQEPRAARRTGH